MIHKEDRTKLLVLSGLLTAISIVFSRFFSVQIPIGGVGALRLGFGPLPVIIAGLIGGPAVGGAVGTAADIVGFFINPFGGAFIPHITAVSTLTGMLPVALIRLLYPKLDRQPNLLSYLAAIGLSQAILHIGAMSLILYIVFGVPVQASLLLRGMTQAILVPVYSAIAYAIVNGAYPSLALQKRRSAQTSRPA